VSTPPPSPTLRPCALLANSRTALLAEDLSLFGELSGEVISFRPPAPCRKPLDGILREQCSKLKGPLECGVPWGGGQRGFAYWRFHSRLRLTSSASLPLLTEACACSDDLAHQRSFLLLRLFFDSFFFCLPSGFAFCVIGSLPLLGLWRLNFLPFLFPRNPTQMRF